MSSIPFEEEIVNGMNYKDSDSDSDSDYEVLPTVIESKKEKYMIASNIITQLQSDPSQLNAVEAMLNQRFTLVQGPPGTGKTYVGVQAALAILAESKRVKNKEIILCLCYTNHALDDFLLSLHEEGLSLNKIVRIGRSPKINEKLKCCCLTEKEETKFNNNQSRLFAIEKNIQEEAKIEIDMFKKNICNRQWGWGSNSWSTVSIFLKDGNEQQLYSFKQLEVSDANDPINNMKLVGKKNKPISTDYLWKQWCDGRSRASCTTVAPTIILIPDGIINIWDLNKEQRKSLRTEWKQEWLKPFIYKCIEYINIYEKSIIRLQSLRVESKVPAANKALIIGCTTTSAAKNSMLLSQIAPTTVLIEEAAEILESSVLTSLGSSVERVIMIGDHKQLRPKLESYHLRKESGQGIDFDVSLFERLANQPEFPIHTLNIQHRMRPEISDLIRKTTYPELKDSKSVLGRDNIKGVLPNSNVIFLNHNHNESNDEERASLGMNSKINLHEVELTCCIVKYFLQQGYYENEIVVLTPYLGQLLKLQSELKKSLQINIEINDLDCKEIKKFDPDIEIISNKKNLRTSVKEEIKEVGEEKKPNKVINAIKVATIDNFQGEEARIVISSLVRGNNENDIGFVSGAERVNVLLSRARDGMVIIGNADTFLNARSRQGRKLWSDIIGIIKDRDQFHDSFPASCQNHNKSPNFPLIDAKSFQQNVPDGGCCQPCGFQLPLCPFGHLCPMKCHFPRDTSHQFIRCMEVVMEKCPNTINNSNDVHYVQRICSNSQAKKCLVKITNTCSNNHLVFHKCCDTLICEICNSINLLNKERELKQLEDILKRNTNIKNAELEKEKIAFNLYNERLEITNTISISHIQKEKRLMEIEIANLKVKRQSITKKMNEIGGEINNSFMLKKKRDQGKTDNISDESQESKKKIYKKNEIIALNNDSEIVEMDIMSDSLVKNSNNNEVVYSLLKNNNDLFFSNSFLNDEKSIELNLKIYDINHIRLLLNLEGKKDWIAIREVAMNSTNGEEDHIPTHINNLHLIVNRAFDILSRLNLQGYKNKLLDDAERLCKNSEDIYLSLDEKNIGIDKINSFVVFGIATYIFYLVSSCNLALKYTCIDKCREFIEIYNCIKSVSLSYKDESDILILSSRWYDEAAMYINLMDKATEPSNLHSIIQDNASNEWENSKIYIKNNINYSFEKSPSIAMDKLMKLTGLESIKKQFMSEFNRINLSKEQGISFDSCNYNTRCDGNPGTGKTTVARLYGEFLIDIGVLPKESLFKETTGSELISNGLKGLILLLTELKEVKGGIIFVDEAYQLNPQEDNEGKKILNFLLVHAERLKGEYGNIVWVFAGYKKQMDKLFEFNPGLPSRFPNQFHFEDYTDDELLNIFEDLLLRSGEDISSVKFNETKKNIEKKKTSSILMSNSNYQYSNKPNEIDRWGNLWTWNSNYNIFEDEYNNITGYGVNNLGTTSNPIISRRDNIAWLFDSNNNVWFQNNNLKVTTTQYPGLPTPKSSTPSPFVVVDKKWSRIAIKRIGKLRGTNGFGNARSINNLFNLILKRQACRIATAKLHNYAPNIFQFERDDLLGPKASNKIFNESNAWKKLNNMEGLVEVKEAIRNFQELVVQNADREENEKPMHDIVLNRIFIGNPGVGKTTVAILYAQILTELGLLSKGEVIMKNASDFIGSTLGSSESITKGILTLAEGNVLIIDEAYNLNPSSGIGISGSKDIYRESVIDTLVECISGKPGEDRAVILLGYKKEMEDFLASSNPGLSRRFQMENSFQFHDYDDTSLVRIILNISKNEGIELDLDTAIFAIKQLAKAKCAPNFGNAGAVQNLLSEAKINLSSRQSKLTKNERIDKFIKSDFCPGGIIKEQGNEEDIFSDLVGCDEIIIKLKEYRDTISLAKKLGQNPKENIEFNFLFVGSPGTGKTTVARKMGKLFYSLGLLPTAEVIEITASDLITGYVGQASKKTADVLIKARGKVLFIDEAYQLNPKNGGGYMQEVVDSMVQAMTSKDLIQQIVIILAGYENEIDDMLQVNKGLKSRFSEKITFKDFNVNVVEDMIKKNLILLNNGMKLTSEMLQILPDISKRLKESSNFANGRDIDTLCKRTFRQYASRISSSKTLNRSQNICQEDIENSLRKFLDSKSKPNNDKIQLEEIQQIQYDASPPSLLLDHNTILSMKETTKEKNKEIINDDIIAPIIGGFEKKLQKILDERGLNSQEGVVNLSSLSIESDEIQSIIKEISIFLNISYKSATEKIIKWRENLDIVKNKLKEQIIEKEMAKLEKRKALLPIWRCAVCGRADLPYIYCYVSPYIIRYDEFDIID